jgi:hypothetical protein
MALTVMPGEYIIVSTSGTSAHYTLVVALKRSRKKHTSPENVPARPTMPTRKRTPRKPTKNTRS